MNRENFEKLLQANREAPAELFNMDVFFGAPTACGTPACLLGNLALRPDLQSTFVYKKPMRPVNFGHVGTAEREYIHLDGAEVCEHFGITSEQADALFDSDGCNNAGTNRDKALAYVEHFMATGETPHDCDGFDDEECDDEECDCDGSGGYDEDEDEEGGIILELRLDEKDIIDEGFDADALPVAHGSADVEEV